MAPLTRRRKAAAVAAAAPAIIDPADRLSHLPASILAEIVSYLPAKEAVRTRVLARTWRHVWKFTTKLLIRGDDVQEVRAFVDRLLRARLAGLAEVEDDACGGGGGGPLDVCEIEFNPFHVDDVPVVNRWVRLAVACRVKSLSIDMWREVDADDDNYFRMSSRRLVSHHLTSLHLSGLCFSCVYLDFSGCPALERLEIHFSHMVWMRKMTSPSVKHLVMRDIVCNWAYRFRICAPRLVSLRLVNIFEKNPVLESMPELEVAHVEIVSSEDSCYCDDRVGCKHVMGDVHTSDSDTEEESDASGGQNTTKSVLLEGLSQAQHLRLMACKSTYIFRRDLRWCPTFPKLKTLVLNDNWCEPCDCRSLVCILEHAPVLEELTVIFSEQSWSKHTVELEGELDATVESNMMSQSLKTVKIKCGKIDDSVLRIIKYLRTLNIKPVRIQVSQQYFLSHQPASQAHTFSVQ